MEKATLVQNQVQAKNLVRTVLRAEIQSQINAYNLSRVNNRLEVDDESSVQMSERLTASSERQKEKVDAKLQTAR